MNNRNSRLLPFVTGAAVGVLGGLIGLGGAEFRLPVLVGWFQFPVLLAIVINLLVSLVTVIVSLVFRANVQGVALLVGQWPIVVNLLSGSLLGSYFGVQFATRASDVKGLLFSTPGAAKNPPPRCNENEDRNGVEPA